MITCLASAAGDVVTFGDAHYQGHWSQAAPFVALVALGGAAYALADGSGGVASFPMGRPFAQATNRMLTATLTGAAATLDGNGLWEVSADGTVITVGTATYMGSLADCRRPLAAPVVAMAAATGC
jgi:hypothetical protein